MLKYLSTEDGRQITNQNVKILLFIQSVYKSTTSNNLSQEYVRAKKYIDVFKTRNCIIAFSGLVCTEPAIKALILQRSNSEGDALFFALPL